MDASEYTHKTLDAGKEDIRVAQALRRAQDSISMSKQKKALQQPTESVRTPSAKPVAMKLPKNQASNADKAKREADKAYEKGKRYKQAFPAELKEVKVPPASADADSKRAFYDECKMILGSEGAVDAVFDAVGYVGVGLEWLSIAHPNLVPLNLSSPVKLSTALASDHARTMMEREAKELAIEYQWLFSTRAEMRMLKNIYAVVMMVAQKNASSSNSDL